MGELNAMKVTVIVLISTVLLVAVGLVAMAMAEARSLPEGPRELVWDRTPCAHCRMHVGEPGFAAQIQTGSGAVLGFDDPGCLFLHLEREHPDVHAIYFRHMKEERWLPREKVAFVRVDPTPMGFGIGAVDAGGPGSLSFAEARQHCLQRGR